MELEYARSFRDLLVDRRAFSVAKRIFEFSKLFPEEEKHALTSQIRRSSRSIGAQITEAWAKRKYEKHFTSKLTDADGEQLETQHWARVAEAFCSASKVAETSFLYNGADPDDPLVFQDNNQSDY